MLFFVHGLRRRLGGWFWAVVLAATSSCEMRTTRNFRIVSASPAYLLRSPNRQTVSFSEILKQYNGFVPGGGWVDLRPGMELRVENAYYTPGKSRKGLDGFLGTEIARYKVNGSGLRLLSFQSMPNRPPTDVPVQKFISPRAMAAPYGRFYFEVLFNAGSHAQSSVLLTGESMNDIQRLAERMDEPEKVCGSQATNCTVFPDACSVSVEMEIMVNGQQQTVVWNSTLKTVTGGHARHVGLKRLYGGRLITVAMRQNDPAVLQLPLLPGDQMQWR